MTKKIALVFFDKIARYFLAIFVFLRKCVVVFIDILQICVLVFWHINEPDKETNITKKRTRQRNEPKRG